MTKKAIIIVGLPGSGKTTYAKRLGGLLVDDASLSPQALAEAMVSDHPLVVITDPNSCTADRAKIEAVVASHGRTVEIICFENDPEACWVNIERRGDQRISKSALFGLSSLYNIDGFAADKIEPVFRPMSG